MKTEFTIGKILRPRGLKGEVKFETYTSNPERFRNLKKILLDNKSYTVEKISLEGAFGYIKFAEIMTIEQAELLRNKLISVKRADLPKPPKDKFYIVDMIGLDVIVGGKSIGELKDVLQYGSADVYVVKLEQGSVSFPAIKDLVLDIDIDGGKIILDDKIFPRVAVYN